jgi:hypothetical protein
MELGLTRYAGGFQATLGFFNRCTTRTKTASEILDLLSSALAAEGVKIDFGQTPRPGPDGTKEIEIDPHRLQSSVGNYFITVSVRIDQENNDRECNGFIPEERDGGFGIMLQAIVQSEKERRWGEDDMFCREVYNSGHLADPSCNLEIAVAEIKRIIQGLT